MPPIEAITYYKNRAGRYIEVGNLIKITPGNEKTLNGKVSTIKVSCNAEDDGGTATITEVSEGVKVGGLFGVGGLLGVKKETHVGHSMKNELIVRSRHGDDEFSIQHNPYSSDKSPLE